MWWYLATETHTIKKIKLALGEVRIPEVLPALHRLIAALFPTRIAKASDNS